MREADDLPFGSAERRKIIRLCCRYNPRIVDAAECRDPEDELTEDSGRSEGAWLLLVLEHLPSHFEEALRVALGPAVDLRRTGDGRACLRGPLDALAAASGRTSTSDGEFDGLIGCIRLALGGFRSNRFRLRLGDHEWRLGGRTMVMGIINVTPDSFSDGGEFLRAERAVEHGRELVAAGADMLDIGGESTRPGAAVVPAEEQADRIVPVIRELADSVDVPISVDTTSAVVAEKALDAGAGVVNDVSALRGDPRMAGVVAERGAPVVLMHMLGTPRTMQQNPVYEYLIAYLCRFLRERIDFCLDKGIAEEQIIIDPGIGFGKTVGHNLEIIRRLAEFRSLGRPILLGSSRKSFIGKVLDLPVDQRLAGTTVSHVFGCLAGVAIVRAHDVAEAVQVVRMADAITGRAGC